MRNVNLFIMERRKSDLWASEMANKWALLQLIIEL